MHHSPSSQALLPLHLPPSQVSHSVHRSPSSQGIAMVGVWVQPILLTQPSIVHGFLSSHCPIAALDGPEMQTPLTHLSSTVQKSPSSHGQPVFAVPGEHFPPLQWSPAVHA